MIARSAACIALACSCGGEPDRPTPAANAPPALDKHAVALDGKVEALDCAK